ncbi:MAG: fibronectin type III domain-containing protein [Proteobacteria bacterium]|nr:fibronectin type III domain-containing protein [Pseudomonadota bacterium]
MELKSIKLTGRIAPSNAYFELANPIKARFVRYVHGHVGAANLAISDIRIFGNAGGKIVKPPKDLVVKRDTDERNAFVTWQKVKGAVGYNIRWGIKPDRLHLNYQIFADEPNAKEIRALNKGVSYYFAIEAFDENGISGLSKIIEVK